MEDCIGLIPLQDENMSVVSQFFKALIIPVKTICPTDEGTSLASRLDCWGIARLPAVVFDIGGVLAVVGPIVRMNIMSLGPIESAVAST